MKKIKRDELMQKFVMHLAYYRGLHKHYTSIDLQSHFWTSTIDAHLLQASIYWNMIFGNSSNNDFHWHHDFDTATREEFVKHLHDNGIDWNDVWKNMNEFRNQYSAHRDEDFNSPVPMFDGALKVTYLFSDWSNRTNDDSNYYDYEELYKLMLEDATKIAPLIMKYNEMNIYQEN